MSRRRHLAPFRKYSDWPSRDTLRFTEISLNLTNSPGAVPSLLSNTSSMDAWPTGLRALEPLKMTSVMDSPRRYLAELSPITQRTASMMLDLPQPLGPTTAVMLDGNGTVVGSTNDLKPASLMDFSLISGVLLHENAQNLCSLMFTEVLDNTFQKRRITLHCSVCQMPEKSTGFGYLTSEMLKGDVIGTTDGGAKVFERFFKKRVFNQPESVTHNAKAGINHLLRRITCIGIESINHRLHFLDLAHHTTKLGTGPALKHLAPEHAQQINVDIVERVNRIRRQIRHHRPPAWKDFHQVPTFKNKQRFAHRATADVQLTGHFQLLNPLPQLEITNNDPLADMLRDLL